MSSTGETTAEWADVFDRRRALRIGGLLARFNVPELLSAADLHVATRLGVLVGETDERVLLATALAVRAVRHGSVCVDLVEVSQLPVELAEPLPWPEPGPWIEQLSASALLAEEVLRLVGSRLYLDRYWREEGQVCHDLVARLEGEPPLDEAVLLAGLDRLYPPPAPGEPDYREQREAAEASARRWTSVLTGGPGTGKTTTVARLLVLLSEQHEATRGQPPRIAMCAPTAKASVRLKEAVQEAAGHLCETDQARLAEVPSSTLHRLLGYRHGAGGTRFRHDRTHKLPHDVVVVDETSMVSLTHMARLLEALRPTTRLVLVGDKDQLASVEAGAVLTDLVDGLETHPQTPVSRLLTTHRYGARIGALADAVRRGDADHALHLLRSQGVDVERPDGDHSRIELIDPDDTDAMAAFRADVRDQALAVRHAAEEGEAAAALHALDQHRMLCAHREGPSGVAGWNRQIETALSEETARYYRDEWYPGRPVLVTTNDYGLELYNGDLGVTVRQPDGRLVVAIQGRPGPPLATTRLSDVDTVYAMTVHKAQGSQARVVSVVMPPEESLLLTRELFYTAVTRASEVVRVVGTEATIRAAIERHVPRASGLKDRLAESWSSGHPRGRTMGA